MDGQVSYSIKEWIFKRAYGAEPDIFVAKRATPNERVEFYGIPEREERIEARERHANLGTGIKSSAAKEAKTWGLITERRPVP